MQSFRERCGFHGNQQNYQPSSQDSSRLENYRHQSHPGLNCVRQRQITKGYYAQGSYQGYENNTGEKYPRGDKHMNIQQLQGRVSFASFPEGNVYPGHYSGEDGLQNWGQSQALSGTKYEENIIKKTSGEGRGYQDPATQIPFRSHSLHHPQQPNLPYAKLPRQKVQNVQNDVASSPLSFSQSSHFNQNFPTSTYSSVPGSSPVSHSFKSCTAPSNPPHERAMATTAMATTGQRVQSIHGYQSSRMSSYEQTQRHHAQETLHYQNMAKYHGQHYSQQGQAYCQPEAPSRTPEQYYQTFSPSASHSPARSVGRSPSYSSTPSPLMPNIENFQYNQQQQQQQQHNTNTFPIGISDHSHYMPLLNPSPTGTSSPESQTKNLQNDKIPETLLSDLSLQSLTALTSQVENISNTVQQLLLSKSGIPQKKGVKTSPRTSEQMKGQHCSSESSTYSSEQMGTPLSETLSTPQSVHAEIQDADYLSGSEDQLERNYLYCGPGQSPGRANSTKMKPESISTCSVTSPDNLSTKSDDSFQSIHANLPLETFAKLVSSDRSCPHLLVNALSQEELSTEIIVLQDAIDNEKAWSDSPELDNNSPKSPFSLENHTCVESVAKNTWADQGSAQLFPESMKKSAPEKSPLRNHNDFGEEYYEKKDFLSVPTKVADATENSVVLSIEKNLEAATSSASYTSYSNTVANTTCSKSSDPFDWPDKSMTESCLRWKEIELTFHSSDLQKGLFQSKENKVDSQLDVPDVETQLENDSGEEFNKEVAEDMTYTEDCKADNEKWLEDTRDCYTEDDFNDIPDLPSQKESNLEPEDYSSLCDFSERKSFIYDESLPKPTRDSEALSSINTPESMENPSTEEKNDSAASPQLSGNSIILLGPTVETESKVKSWFESTIPHNNQDDPTEKSEKSIEVSSLETSSLMEVEETDPKVINNQLPIETEEKPEKKPQRGRRNLGRATEIDESDFMFQNPSESNSKVEMEVERTQAECASSVMVVDKIPVTEPARMCTRSSTARVEPQGCSPGIGMKAPLQDKTTKRGAFGERERAPYKTGRRGGKNAVKLLPTSNDQNLFLLQNKSPTILTTGQKSKENNISILKDERSMILRSRSKKQELFPAKRRRGKRGMNFVLKKRSSLKKIIANSCTAPDAFQMMPKVRKRMKLSSSGVAINVKPTERPLHSLKRKSNLISPVPAKKRNLILHGKKTKEQKSETPSNLFKKIKPIKKEKVKLTIAAKKNCKVMLSAPSVRMAPDVCLKIKSRSSYHGTMKTKVLPPRKGRGLKLEAIVQKMTSPSQKKQGVAIGGMTNGVLPNNNNSNTLTQARELRDSSLVIADSETKMLSQEVTQIEAQKSEPEMHTASCRGSNNRSFKGKPLPKKKVTSNSLHGQVSTLTATKPERNCTSTKRPNVVPKKKTRRGRSKSSQSTSKTATKKLLGASPSVLLTTRDKALSENALLAKKCLPTECKYLKLKEGSSLPEASEETLSQTRSRKKIKYPSFSSYTKRQRKCSPRNKSTSQAPATKRRTKRPNIPHVTPKEPEIKLKYVSCKPVRAESRARFFSPYVQVEKRNAFTTTCTVINTAGEETRFLKDRSVVHSPSPAVTFDNQGSLPFSSRMQLGPLVCKSVSSGCLLCCLCRCPANYKDLGDLCGPYYPMDCLPKKKSRPKDKHQTEDTLPEKSSKVMDSICTAGNVRTSCMDSGATDLVKHNTLRSSARGMLRKLPSCYCCNKKAEGTETEKPRKHQCSKSTELHSVELETQEHWVHEACAVWTSGVYLVAGKLYGVHEAIQMAATVLCPRCQKLGATVGCSHKGCTQTYHYVCATEAGCLLSEENFSLRCLKHKRHLV